MHRLSRLQLATCAVRVKMLYTLLDTPAAEKEAGDKPSLLLEGGKVVFDKVSFAYKKGASVLRELSLTAPAGLTTALVVVGRRV